MVSRSLTVLTIAITVCMLLVSSPALAKHGYPVIRGTGDAGPVLLTQTSAFGAGDKNALLGYMDSASGNTWFKTFGQLGKSMYPNDLAVDSSGAAVFICTGQYQSFDLLEERPAYVVKFSQSGDLVWAREINWSNHRLEFNALDLDEFGNIFITGRAYLYVDEFFERGYVFTCCLRPDGEIVWAQRWAADEKTYGGGEGIAVSGNNVAVLANNWIRDDPNDNFSVLMLFYNIDTGALVLSDRIIAGNRTLLGVGAAANDDGEITAVCTLDISGSENSSGTAAVMLYYRNNGDYQFDHWWQNGLEEHVYPQDISAQGNLFYIVGGIGRVPTPPHPSAPGLILNHPLVMIYDGEMPLLIEEIDDDSPPTVDSKFTSVSPHEMGSTGGSVWFAGHSSFDMQYAPIKIPLVGRSGFNATEAYSITAWEAESCGASSFNSTESAVTTVANEDAFGWLNTATIEGYECPNQFIYAGSLIYSSTPPPNAVVTADVTEGNAPLTVNFDASGSTISSGSIVDYQWTAVNITTGELLNPAPGATTSYTFTQPGTYAVHVKVISDKGVESIAWLNITVKP